MPEALWSQNAGVEYSAAEDRRLIGAIWPTYGVLNGLTVTPGTGRTINVSAGRAIIPDPDGGAYLAYFDSSTNNVAVAANTGSTRVDGVYVVVDDPGDGITDIVVVTSDTPTPSDPYIKIATVTVPNGTTSFAQGAINNAVRTEPTDPRYALNSRILYGPVSGIPATLAPGVLYLAHD